MNTMSDALLLACLLSDWNGEPTYCRWCNKPLTGRQRRWCSDVCAGNASGNHWFSSARHRALIRDNRTCVRCESPEIRYDGEGCALVMQLEVHHRDDKADGRHSQCSCAHHIDGLETLCRGCHLAEHGAKASPVRADQLRMEAA